MHFSHLLWVDVTQLVFYEDASCLLLDSRKMDTEVLFGMRFSSTRSTDINEKKGGRKYWGCCIIGSVPPCFPGWCWKELSDPLVDNSTPLRRKCGHSVLLSASTQIIFIKTLSPTWGRHPSCIPFLPLSAAMELLNLYLLFYSYYDHWLSWTL